MGITSLVNINIDLLLVAIAVAGMVVLGNIVIFNDPKSVTSRAFFYFSILTAIWGISNYLEYQFVSAVATLWALRIHLFISVWHAFFFFNLAYVFPQQEITLSKWHVFGLFPLVAFTSFITLTPLTFKGINTIAPAGQVGHATTGPGMLLFSLVAIGCLLSGLYVLLRRTLKERDLQQRQDSALLFGMSLTAFLILIFNVLLPNIFANVSFIPLAALFVLPFVALTFYAIFQHHLFNLRVAATAFLGFMVTVFSFVNIVYSDSASAVMVNLVAFAIILFGSIRIIRNTLDLERANAQQESLLHFVSHEVKSYLTKGMYAFASVKDGDFGAVSPELVHMANDAFVEMEEGVSTVIDIMSAANLRKGVMSFYKRPFDLKSSVEQVIRQQKPAAEKKNLTLDLVAGEGPFTMTGDEEKISRHVIRNLVDNAIKYTLTGDIHVDLTRMGKVIRFSIKDHGVGITAEDMIKLFTEGGKGKDSTKVNVHSTGYGLFVAKTVCDAHGAKIWAESRGPGTGSRFVIEFPIT